MLRKEKNYRNLQEIGVYAMQTLGKLIGLEQAQLDYVILNDVDEDENNKVESYI